MTRIIISPREDTDAEAELEALGPPAPADRAKRLETLQDLRRRMGTDERTQAGAKASAVLNGIEPVREMPLTGSAVFEVDDVDLDALRAALPEYDVFLDRPLSLIESEPSAESILESVTDPHWPKVNTNLQKARDMGFDRDGTGIHVAVLDTGIEPVPELRNQIHASFGRNFSNDPFEPIAAKDTGGHGTKVASLIAGQTFGMAPGARLTNILMMPGGQAFISDFEDAIEFMLGLPNIKVMNMSAGRHDFTAQELSSLRNTIRRVAQAGILPVIAVGNRGAGNSESPGNFDGILSVGASSVGDRVWQKSGSGTGVGSPPHSVPDLVAPGQDVTCANWLGGAPVRDSGSSMAAGVVSGLAALVIDTDPGITVPQLIAEFTDSAKHLPGVGSERQGAGLAQVPTRLYELLADASNNGAPT